MKVDLDRLAALSKAATPGPWDARLDAPNIVWRVHAGGLKVAWVSDNMYPGEKEAILIAELRNSIDALVAECRAAREWLRTADLINGVECRDTVRCIDTMIKAREAYRRIVEGA